MDFDEILETDLVILKCVLCSNWLSCFPIYTTDKKENICGRCAIPSDKKVVMNDAFQAVAKHIFFPCRYTLQGCDQKLRPKEVIFHENRCLFKIVKCPVREFSLCTWEGAKPNLLQHCHESHSDLFLQDGKFNLMLSSEDVIVNHNLLDHDSILFVIVQKFNPFDHFLDFSIFHIESDEDLDQLFCQVELQTDNRHLVATCSTTSYLNQNPTEIYLNSLRDSKTVTTKSATGNIRLQTLIDSNVSSRSTNSSSDLLDQLKCSICAAYILPPILQYLDNSGEHKIVCSKCPVPTTQPTRNFNLDNLANLIDYPCENMKEGCSFVARPSSMLKHKKLCFFQNLSCPVKGFGFCFCDWNGLYENLKIHLQVNHIALYIVRSTVISVKIEGCVSNQSTTGIKPTDTTSCCLEAVEIVDISHSASNLPFGSSQNAKVLTTTASALFSTNSSNEYCIGSSGSVASEVGSGGVSNINSRQRTIRRAVLRPSTAQFGTPTPGFSIFASPSSTVGCNTVVSGFGSVPAPATIAPIFNVANNSLFATPALTTTASSVGKTNAASIISEPKLNLSEGGFFKKNCYLMKYSNKLFRVCYGETARKFIWCVHIIGPFTEEFMFSLEIIDKSQPKKLFKMQLPTVDFTNDDDLFNSSCFVWKKDVVTYLTDNEISFKINVFK